uniref:Ovule protein n=1 Tax=Haemonchus placei TaxID=6290 RepID=A0A0N4XBA4_HAEPC
LAFALRDIVVGHRRPLVNCPCSPFSYIFRRATFMGQSARSLINSSPMTYFLLQWQVPLIYFHVFRSPFCTESNKKLLHFCSCASPQNYMHILYLEFCRSESYFYFSYLPASLP